MQHEAGTLWSHTKSMRRGSGSIKLDSARASKALVRRPRLHGKQKERQSESGGSEIAHGRFENGVGTIYTSRFHLIEPNAHLIYAFDMQVNGKLFSVSLACVEFER
jgi:hypothetical protein